MREQDAAGFVLAGGRSSRMGRDKALVEFCGEPLVVGALGILSGAGLAASIAGARSALGSIAPVVEDLEPGLGPLGGICSALALTAADNMVRWGVFVPVDLPLLPASLVEYLVNHAEVTGAAVTLVSVTGFAQTFPAVLARAALPWLQSELAAGRRGCFAAFQAAAAGLGQPVSVVAAELLVQAGQVAHPEGLPASLWFLNVNSEGNLRRAEAHRTRG